MRGEGLPSGPEGIVRDILHGLTEGRFAPGQRLSEPDLVALYGVGRSTVREALARLAAAGVVVQSPHRGAQIRRLGPQEARDVLRVAGVLLGLAARQAAEAVAAGASAQDLESAAETYSRSPDPRARARFYRALTRLAGNAELERLLPILQLHLIRAQMRGVETQAPTLRGWMVQAIAKGDPTRAEASAKAHVEALRAALPEAAPPQAQP